MPLYPLPLPTPLLGATLTSSLTSYFYTISSFSSDLEGYKKLIDFLAEKKFLIKILS